MDGSPRDPLKKWFLMDVDTNVAASAHLEQAKRMLVEEKWLSAEWRLLAHQAPAMLSVSLCIVLYILATYTRNEMV